MALILARGNPFEVGGAGIGPVPVLVIDFHSAGAWPQEGVCDEPVNCEGFALSISRKADARITVTSKARLANSARASAVGRLNPPDTPLVADFVPAFVTEDGAPVFSGGCVRLREHRNSSFRCQAAGRSRPSPLLYYSTVDAHDKAADSRPRLVAKARQR
jgi:hypothetical protein